MSQVWSVFTFRICRNNEVNHFNTQYRICLVVFKQGQQAHTRLPSQFFTSENIHRELLSLINPPVHLLNKIFVG